MAFQIQIGNCSPVHLIKASFEKTLNGVNNFEIMLDGITTAIRNEIDTEKPVKIYRNGILEIQGKIEDRESHQGGGMIIWGFGDENDLMEAKCPSATGVSKVYTSTNDHAIFTDLVTSVTGWGVDLSGSTLVSVSDYRTSTSMSVWEGVIHLLELTNKDVGMDYTNKKLQLFNKKGATNGFAFKEGLNAGGIIEKKRKIKARKIVVWGKGDGPDQIKGSATTGSGIPSVDVRDPNILSVTAANARAQKELAAKQQEIYNHQFKPLDPQVLVDLGDSGPLVAASMGLSRNVDIVRLKRSVDINSVESLELEVTNTEYRRASKSLSESIAFSESINRTTDTSMQGGPNTLTYTNVINAKSTVPAEQKFQLTDSVIKDQTGTIKITNFSVDYKIEGYNSQYGGATFTGPNPPVDVGISDNTAGTTNSTAPGGTLSWSSVSIGTSGNTCRTFTLSTASPPPFRIAVISFSVAGGTPGNFRVRLEDDAGSSIYDAWHFIQSSSTTQRIRVPIDENAGFGWTGAKVIMATTTGTQSSSGNIEVREPGPHFHFPNSYASASSNIDGPGSTYIKVNNGVVNSGSINATNVAIKVDFWNGAAWINKLTLSAQPLFATDKDLSNGGTLPDASGYWRVTIAPNGVSPDLVNMLVKIKHPLDSG